MIFYIYIYRTKLYFRWQFILNGLSHVIEFWDSKMSGKKKIAVDSKVIYFKQFDGDITFGLTFTIGYNTFNLKYYFLLLIYFRAELFFTLRLIKKYF